MKTDAEQLRDELIAHISAMSEDGLIQLSAFLAGLEVKRTQEAGDGT